VAGLAGVLIGAGVLVPAWDSVAKESEGAVPVAVREDKEEKGYTVEQIMEDMHGENGLRTQVARAVRADKVQDAKKPMEQWVKLAAQLGKATPPRNANLEIDVKGKKVKSWPYRAAEYEKQVQNVAAAVKSEKPEAVRDALSGIARGCNGCHQAHKKQ